MAPLLPPPFLQPRLMLTLATFPEPVLEPPLRHMQSINESLWTRKDYADLKGKTPNATRPTDRADVSQIPRDRIFEKPSQFGRTSAPSENTSYSYVNTAAILTVAALTLCQLFEFYWLLRGGQLPCSWLFGEKEAKETKETTSSGNSRPLVAMAVLGAVIAGFAQPVQATLNANLAIDLGGGGGFQHVLFASYISAQITSQLLTLGSLFVPPAPRSVAAPTQSGDEFRWWMICGGPLAAVYTAGLAAIRPKLSLEMLFVAVNSGQLMMAVITDQIGFAGTQRRPLSCRRAVGIFLDLCASVVLQLPNDLKVEVALDESVPVAQGAEQVLYVLFAWVCGACIPLLACINRRLAVFVGGPIRTSAVSVHVTSICLAVASVAALVAHPILPDMWTHPAVDYLGGLLGPFGVLLPVALGPILGMAVYYVLQLAGQLIMSVTWEMIILVSAGVEITTLYIVLCTLAVTLSVVGGFIVRESL
tara:strand:+ start:3216 stop:4643 length:1428 start_codon:yes stop_codon:yes gene_type:complete